MIALLRRLFPVFRPLEKELLRILTEGLDPANRRRLNGQIAEINLVQRLNGNKEINLYRVRGGKVVFPSEELKMLNRREEIILATLKYRIEQDQRPFKAVFWNVQGIFFNITHDQPPALSSAKIEVIKFIIQEDALHPERDALPTGTPLSGWIADWQRRWKIKDVKAPLTPAKAQELLDLYEAKLPDDYLELIHQTEGMTVETIRILGLREIESISSPTTNYFKIADLGESGLLALKANSPEIVKIDLGGEGEMHLGTSLRVAVERVLAMFPRH